MADILTHTFVSAKADSPDSSLVSASEWNDGHLLTGGSNGQIIVFDNTQPKNARWTDGPTLTSASATGPTGAATATNLAPVTFTANSVGVALVSFSVYVATSGATTVVVAVTLNGVDQYTQGIVTPFNMALSYSSGFNYGAGSHTIAIRLAATAGTITQLNVNNNVLRMGR
jgi:hypothetical protein